MRNILKTILPYVVYVYLGSSVLFPDTLKAATSVFTYGHTDEQYLWGTGKKESYDVAIKIDDKSLIGSKVIGMSVFVQDGVAMKDVSAWLTTDLVLDEEGNNTPNITSTEAACEGGEITATFETPYVITDSGVYVGYSLTTTGNEQGDKYPLAVQKEINPNGFFLHTSRTYLEWTAKSEEFQLVSSLKVYVESEAMTYAVGINSIGEVYVDPDTDTEVPIVLANHGTHEVSSIVYEYSIDDGIPIVGTHSIDPPLPATFGGEQETMIPVKSPIKTGTSSIKVTILEVDGQSNQDTNNTCMGKITSLAWHPRRNVLFEEYTGLWCGACPRGYVAMEEMHERYPNDFYAISYHNSDQMGVISPSEYPNSVEGYPAAFINRSMQVDPYYGVDFDVPMGIENIINQIKETFTPVDIYAECWFSELEPAKLEVTSTVKYVFDHDDCNYMIAYMLLADGLTNPRWIQSSYYTGQEELIDETAYWAPFVDNEYVFDLDFNDILVSGEYIMGIPGSVPSVIESGREYAHTVYFNIDELVNNYGDHIVDTSSNLKVMTAILDSSTGEIMNCALAYPSRSYVKGITDSRIVISETWYTLAGTPVAKPANGIFLRVVRFDDGKIKTEKIKLD